MKEEWKAHPTYPDYEGSTLGKIRSWKSNSGGRRPQPRLLNPSVRGKRKLYPYPSFELYLGKGKSRGYFVHRFIAECFLPNPENKPQVNHKNSKKSDNRVRNLEWVTASENIQHSFDEGLADKRGEKHHLHKLTEREVLQIREDYSAGVMDQSQLADKYSVTCSNISQIITGNRWKHLDGASQKDGRSWRSKLTMDGARDVRKRFTEGSATKSQLAEEYGVTFATIFEIIAGRRYKEPS